MVDNKITSLITPEEKKDMVEIQINGNNTADAVEDQIDHSHNTNANPANSPQNQSNLFKSESVDLTSTHFTPQNPQLQDEETKDQDEENYNIQKTDAHSIYKGLDFNDIEAIKTYVLKYKSLCEEFEAEFKNPEVLEYYLLSKSFINEWKEYVSYDQLLKGDPPLKSFGKGFPQYYNKDLFDDFFQTSVNSEEFIYVNDEDKCELKSGLQEGTDFQIVNKEIMEFFKKNFHGRDILRRAYILPDGHKRIEIYYRKISFILITNQVLKDADCRQIFKFKVNYALVFSQKTLKQFKDMMTEWVIAKLGKKTSYFSTTQLTYKSEQIRLWKLDTEISLTEAFEYVKNVCNKYNSYDYRIEMKGKSLEKDLEIKIEELNLKENEYLIVEVREENKGWSFMQEGLPSIEKCEYCNRYEKLTSFCACKKVSYCNEECRMKDKRFHSMRCEKTDEDEVEILQITENSRMGLTGLSNLGNTCFMNSALQCISHTFILTKYFLEDRYKPEINITNVLGTKGKLTEKYSILLKNLWLKTNPVFSPYGIKAALAQLNPMFSGYNQHDSQEFLSYLLDGLHEDLNRVKIKPYTETLESDGRPDEIIARASWFNHLKRNNSIITDLMHGQYKSKIICPTCGHVSITFDPFLTCTLPLPTKEKKKTDFYFIFADNHKIPVKIEVWFKKRNHFISNLKDTVIEEMKNLKSLTPKSFNFYFLSNSSLTKVHPSTPTNEVSKKRKMGNLFAVEIDPELLSAPESEIVEVPVTFNKKEHYYSSYYTKRPFTFVRPMHFLRTDTTNDIHLKIFKYFRFFFEELLENIEEKEEFNKLNDLEAYAKLFGKPDERPYDILLSTNARSYMSCFFCGEYRCENCKLSEKDDETLDDLLKKIKTKEFTFEMEVYWPNISNANIEIGKRFNKYDKLNKEDSEEEKQGEEKKNFEETKGSSDNKRPFVITKNLPDEKNTEIEEKTLAECFKLFSEPETLNADNAWYCSVCKEHKEATKEMKIYKAPKYFILHLKRFKGGESILSSGKISTKINFPVILDLTDYVLNHEVPTDYKPIELDPEILNKKKDIEKISIEIEEEIKKDESPVVINKNKECPAKMEEEIMENENLEKNGKKLLYRLYAISNHYGSVGFGHYTAFGLHPKDNNWYCFDDSSVNKVTEDQIVTSAAYILFYEKIYDVDEKICDFQISVPNPQGENQNHNNVGEINSNFLENACLNSNSLNVEGENIIEQNVTDIDVSGSPEKEREEILEEEIKTAGGDEED